MVGKVVLEPVGRMWLVASRSVERQVITSKVLVRYCLRASRRKGGGGRGSRFPAAHDVGVFDGIIAAEDHASGALMRGISVLAETPPGPG